MHFFPVKNHLNREFHNSLIARDMLRVFIGSTIDQGSKAMLGKSSQENKILTSCSTNVESSPTPVSVGLNSIFLQSCLPGGSIAPKSRERLTDKPDLFTRKTAGR
jgi:hypothetical protein